jgi:hypothetical protein
VREGKTNPWIGVDLDGTLATYHGWVDHTVIGEPIEPMVTLVKGFLAEGTEVRIFTARATEWEEDDPRYAETVDAIHQWCLQHIGQSLQVTSRKDLNCVAIYDDRAYGVFKNTGIIRL